jgi:outer membrane protein assembly factor BamB
MRDSRSALRLGLYFALILLVAGRTTTLVADDWPQWLGAARDGVWRETALLTKFPEAGPKVLWRATLGTGYAGPAVAEGRVYVMDLERELDENGQPRRATRQGMPGHERVLCLNAGDGKVLWKHEYDCPYTISYPNGPRTTPVVDGASIYTLGAMGDLFCLSASDGQARWSKKLTAAYNTEPPVWGYASHLLVDGELLFTLAGGEGSAIVALNKQTGEEVWRALSSQEVGYSPPMIHELAGKRQLVVWLSEAIYGLDPTNGKELWKVDYPQGVPMQRPAVNIITVRKVGADRLFVASFYHGPMMVQVAADGASVVWKGKSNNPHRPDGAHCMMATPVFTEGLGFANGSIGDLVCFNVADGAKLWESYEPLLGKKTDCGTVFIVPQGDRYVMFNDQGELILAELTAAGYKQLDRAKIIEPNGFARGRDIVWSHPAFAERSVFARNDKEIVRVSLEAEG